MSEFVWYSRLAVWAGALVLLAQALAGRGTSLMTLLAILCLAIGFLAFLAGLAATGPASSTVPGPKLGQDAPPSADPQAGHEMVLPSPGPPDEAESDPDGGPSKP